MTKIKNQTEVLSRLNRFAMCYGKVTTIEELAADVSEVLDDLLDIESSGLYLYDFKEKRLKLLVAKGFTDEERKNAELTAMDRHPGHVFRTGQPIDIPDTENDPAHLTITSKRSFIVRSRLYVPVLNGLQPVGAFGIVSARPNRFTEENKIILTFICNIAGGIYAAILNNAGQKEAHDRMAAITIRLETLIKNLQAGILVEDQDRRIALVNKTFCNMFGIPVEPELLFGSDCSDSAEQSKGMFADPGLFVSRIEVILREKLSVTGEELELVDGRIFERDYIPIFLEGRFLGNLWQYRDITGRVQIENDLRKATEEARSANLAKSTFLANMSHEIRTPLNAVIGLSRLMQDTPLNNQQQQLNEKLLISGENLLGIINEILDFSKIEAGRVELEAIPFTLDDVLARVYSFLSHAAEEKSITLNAGIDKPFQKAVIGDPIRLQQILTNLVNNAIKFTSSGGVDIACTLVSESAGRAAFKFVVSDTGIGISEENLKNIFEKFKQEDESVTRIYGGTGLGLAISRQLVGLMGGELHVESEKGIGSRFFFTLEYDTTDVAILREANRKIYIDQEALKGKKILVVEDNEFNQFIAHSILTKWNIQTDMAANGKEAIEKLTVKNYDLVLMDMQMPVMDGCTATRFIRNEMAISTQIIALTAFATKDAIEKSIEAGMNGYITKPFDEETLFSQLLSAFNITPRYITEPDAPSLAGIPEATGLDPWYDLESLNGLFGDDKAEILDIIEKFIELTPEYAEALFAAFEKNNMAEVASAAHKIKSSLELLANSQLRNNIRLIHDYAQTNQNLGELPGLLKYLRNNIPLLLRQLTQKAGELRGEPGKT
ncbi:MAG: ATP-binding protein [Bacteroidota bacterium]